MRRVGAWDGKAVVTWRKRRTDAIAEAILAAVGRGMSPQAAAQHCSVSLQRVLGTCAAAERRQQFVQEHAESGGRVRLRTLGPRSAGKGA